MPTTAAKLLVELDGRNDRLIAALGGGEDALQKFRNEAKQSKDALAQLDKQIATLGQGAGAKNTAATQALVALQRELKSALDAGNLALTDRILLEQRLATVDKALAGATPSKTGLGQVIGQIGQGAQQAAGPVGALATQASSLSNVLAGGAGSVAVAGGIATAAIVALGIAALQASEAVEQPFRRIKAALPSNAGDLGVVRDTVRDLARAFGDAQAEVAHTAEANARYSKSATELAERTRTVYLAQKATGQSAEELAANYDNLADLFNLSGEAASEAFAKVIQLSKGNTTAADTFAQLTKSATGLQKLGLDLDTALRALVAIGEHGLEGKKASAYFEALVNGGAQGKAIIQQLAREIPTVSGALDTLQKDAATATEGVGQSAGKIKERIGEILQDIGVRLGPPAIAVLEQINSLLAAMSGDQGQGLRERANFLRDMATSLPERKGGILQLFSQDEANQAVAVVRSINQLIAHGVSELSHQSTEQLNALAAVLGRIYGQVGEAGRRELDKLFAEIIRIENGRGSASTAGAAKAGGLPTAPKSEQEQDADREKLIKLRDELQNLERESDMLAQKGIGGDAFRQFKDDVDKAKAKLVEFAALHPKLLGPEQLKKDLDALDASVVRMRDTTARDLLGELDKQVAALTGSKLDDYLQQLEEQNRKTKEAIDNSSQLTAAERAEALAKYEQVTALQAQAVAALRATESVESVFRAIDQRSADGFLSPEELKKSTSELDDLGLSLTALLGSLTKDSSAYLAVQKLLLDIEQRRLGVNKQFSEQNPFKIPGNDPAQEKRDDEDRIARQVRLVHTISDAAGAALNLARAFGAVNDATAKILENVIDIGAGIGLALTGHLKEGISQGLKGLTGLLADSIMGPIEKRIQRLKTDATNLSHIAEEKKNPGDLIGSNVTGNEFTQLSKGLDALLAGKGGDFHKVGNINGFFEQFGISGDRMQAIAKSLGITLDGSVGSFRRLREAIQALDLDAFGKGFDGAMHKVDLLDQALGDVTPLDQLIERIKILVGPDGATAFAKILGDIDVSTSGGRQQAIAALVEQLKHVADLKPKDLGGLTLDEFTSQILETIARLRNLDLTPLQKLNNALDIQKESFALTDTPAKDQAAALIETYTRAFADAFKGVTKGSSLADVKASAAAFLKQAGADGILDDTEKAILAGYESIIGALSQADADAKAASDKAKQDAAAGRQKIIDTAHQKIQIDDITDPKEQLKVIFDAYKKAFPTLSKLLGDVNLDDPNGVATFKAAIRRVFAALSDASAEGAANATESMDGVKDALEHLLGDTGTIDPQRAADAAAQFQALADSLNSTSAGAGDGAAELAHLFDEIASGKDVTAELGGATLPEFIQALLDLDGAADSAQQQIASLVEALSGAFSEIDLDARIFGDSVESVLNKKLRAIGVGGNASTAAGREQALAELRALATAHPTDDTLKQLIASLVDDIGRLQPAPGETPAGGGASGGGSTEARGAVQTATIAQADEMIGLLTTILTVDRQIETNTRPSGGATSSAAAVNSALATLRREIAAGPPRVPALPPPPQATAALYAGAARGSRSPLALSLEAPIDIGQVNIGSLSDLRRFLETLLSRDVIDPLIAAINRRRTELLYNQGALRSTAG